MNNLETAVTIRKWMETPKSGFSWPTDTCGYDQHIRFVVHKNQNFKGNGRASFLEFVSDYAKSLENVEG